MSRTAWLEGGDAYCGVPGTMCSNRDCPEPTFGVDHLHITPIDLPIYPLPFGACSEGCAMIIIEEYGFTIVPKPEDVIA